MNKNKVNRFDLTAAFKALDDIKTPEVKGILPNREDLHECFSRKLPTNLLLEDYFDVNDSEELEQAKDDREAEVAKAKLARIEKIVDLDATSEEELAPSYVGKVIVQCPQCMTLFYKNFADLEPADDGSDVVNVSEKCQHCGNTSGYTIIGKVDAVDEETETTEGPVTDEAAAEENTELEPVATEEEATTEETSEEAAAEGTETEETEEETIPAEESLKRKPNLSSADISAIMNNTDKLKIDRQQELVEGAWQKIPGAKPFTEAVDDDLDMLLDSHEFKEPVSDTEVREILAADEAESDNDEPLEEGKAIDWLKKKLSQAKDAAGNAIHNAKNAISNQFKSEDDKLDAVFKDKGYEIIYRKPGVEGDENLGNALVAYKNKLKASLNDDRAAKDLESASNAVYDQLKIAGDANKENVKSTTKVSTYAEAKKKGALSKDTENYGAVIIRSAAGVDPITGPVIISIFEKGQPSVDLAHTIGDIFNNYAHNKKRQDNIAAEVRNEAGLPDGWETWKNYADKDFVYSIGQLTDTHSLGTNTFKGALDKGAEKSGQTTDVLNIYGIDKKGESVLFAKFKGGKRQSDDATIYKFMKAIEGEGQELVDSYNVFDEVEDIDEVSLNEHINRYLKSVYENVNNFELRDCKLSDGTLVLEGLIHYASGKTAPTNFEFKRFRLKEGYVELLGKNKFIANDSKFKLRGRMEESKLITENLSYSYSIGADKVKGKTSKKIKI